MKLDEYNRSYENVMTFLTGEPWCIYEPYATEIQQIMQRRLNGEMLTDQEIAEKIGDYQGMVERQTMVLQAGELQGAGPRIVGGVAILPMNGVMAPKMNLMMRLSGGTSTQMFGLWFKQAMNNSDVHSIVIHADTPGGSARGNQELVDLIEQNREGKKVLSVVEGMCCSAGYYVGSCADEMIASPSSQIGSIGTAIQFIESVEADKKMGLEYRTIRSGENKFKPNPHEKTDEKTLQRLQSYCDSVNEMFLQTVAKYRRVSRQEVLDKFGQGDVFVASKALDLGMIDRIGTLEQVVNELNQSRQSAGGTTQKEPDMKLSQAVLDALVQRELIVEGCSQEVAEVALKAFFAANGSQVPGSDEKIIAALKQMDIQTAPAGNGNQSGNVATPGISSNTQELNEFPGQKAIEEARQQELDRVKTIMANAELFGVPKEMMDKAIDENHSVEAAIKNFTKFKQDTSQPLAQVTKDKADKFAQAATAALSSMCGLDITEEEADLAASLQSASLLDIAEQSLKAHNVRDVPGDREELAIRALRGTGEDLVMIDGRMASGYSRPGDFPNLLSNVQGKMMMNIYEYSQSTYSQWAYRLNPVSNFKPKTLIKMGEFAELPEIIDGEEPEESSVNEDPSFIMVDRYGTKFKITPVMIVDNDLQSWQDTFMDALVAADLTLNRLLLDLLIENVELPDGKALFHADHNNIVPSAGAPSTDELSDMRELLSSQKGPNNKRNLRQRLHAVLFPTELETSMDKLLRVDLRVVSDTASAVDDIFRGRVRPIHEPMLSDHSSSYWYGLADPRRSRGIVYAKMQGYTRPRVRNIFDPKTQCREFHLEDRFGGAVNDYRGWVQNPA